MREIHRVVNSPCSSSSLSLRVEKVFGGFYFEKTSDRLHVEPEVHHIPVLHEVLFSFNAQFAGFAAGGFRF